MQVLIFCLDDEDSILSALRASFPSVGFRKCKANEDLSDEGNRLMILETIPSVPHVMLLDSLDSGWLRGDVSHAVSMLRVLKNLGTLESVRVIAVPEGCDASIAIKGISSIIRQLHP